MFLGVFRFIKSTNFCLRVGFVVFSGSHFYCMRGPSLVELTGDDNSAISTVAVMRIPPKKYV